MRDPSIHIRETDLIKILKKVFMKIEFPYKWRSNWLATEIINMAKSYSVPSRGVSIKTDKLLKKVDKMKLASRSDTSEFAQVLLHCRRLMHHKGIRLIAPGEQEWFDLKAVCKMATEFCNEFDLDLKDGYKEYIQIGASKMQKFGLYKFKNMHASICNYYEAAQEILKDKTPEDTEKCHNIYVATISEKIGTTMGFKNIPEKYVCFMNVKDLANKYKVSFKVYIASQFAGFDWKSSVPDPLQLTGEKAIQRLQVYAFEHSIRLGDRKQGIDFSKIKKRR